MHTCVLWFCFVVVMFLLGHANGLVQDCSNSIANALELLQSCTEPSMRSIYP